MRSWSPAALRDVAVAVAIGAAVAGFLFRTQVSPNAAQVSELPENAGARPVRAAPVPKYADMPQRWRRAPEIEVELPGVAQTPAAATVTGAPATAADRVHTFEKRSGRAFDGAPPVVPHRIDQRDPAACLACHQAGRVIGVGARRRVATQVNHVELTNCFQCHVPEARRARSHDVPSPGRRLFGQDVEAPR